ncbi:MAG: hypothetical protein HY739_02155 [Desulfobacterales bacterium]|nr:hypothetical protein [Desulfobacterales bacterium]
MDGTFQSFIALSAIGHGGNRPHSDTGRETIGRGRMVTPGPPDTVVSLVGEQMIQRSFK